ncbi:MAG: patatin-like phospholipase family protein [Ferruginibacter sp.]
MSVSNKRYAAYDTAKDAGSAKPLLITQCKAEGDRCVAELNSELTKQNRKLKVSDVTDSDGHQYVNLVQKGGGVLGIALAGYTYVLEEVNIRFLRMAGTSAGAINTALMTAIGSDENPKADKKSDGLLLILAELNMFSFVDGHPFAKWILQKIVSDGKYIKRLKAFLLNIGMLFLFLLISSLVSFGLETKLHWQYVPMLTRVLFVLLGFNLLVITYIIIFVINMLGRFRNSGYGINPGKVCLEWIREQLDKSIIPDGSRPATIDDLEQKAGKLPSTLQWKPPNGEAVPLKDKDITADITIITSELVTQNKLEFPKMWSLYKSVADKNSIHPGDFVRASMSIPFFFESFIIDITATDRSSQEVKDAWKFHFLKEPCQIPLELRLVDGGALSNFPINIFFNPKIKEARLPSFGIDLDDAGEKDNLGKDAGSWNVGSYCGRMLNTIRGYYDKDFLLKNKGFARGIGKVDLSDPKYNWLDFFASDQTKMDLFTAGAEAAKLFLLKFDWEKYKEERNAMRDDFVQQTK